MRITFIAGFFFAVVAFAGPVSHFGMLKACKDGSKGQLCSEKTNSPVFFKGPSLYWSSGEGAPWYSPIVVDWFVDNMQIGIIRAAMAIKYYKENSEGINSADGGTCSTCYGYLSNGGSNKNSVKSQIEEVIKAAIVNDIYVIVDWHSHNAHNETSEARTFFADLADRYKDVPNIIWEVYNEPVSASNSDINSHANTIITAIRNAGSNNLVIIGSPNYSQNASGQASNWGTSANAIDKNVAFVFHFYSNTHTDVGGFGANTAMNSGYAVLASEWGAVNADGGGSVNQNGAANTWTTWMDNNKVTNCMWSLSDVDEGASFITNGTSSTELSTSKLTASGQYFQTYMGKNKWTAQIPSGNPKAGDYTATVKDGASITLTASQLGVDGTISSVGEPQDASGTVSGTAEIAGTDITFTTAKSGSPAKVRFNYEVTKNGVTVKGRVTVNITDLKPYLPQVSPISVSKKASVKLSLVNQLKATAPKDDEFTLQSVSVSDDAKGSASKIAAVATTGDTILFTPSDAMASVDYEEVILTYVVRNKAGMTSEGSVVLQLQNQAPTLATSTAYCVVTLSSGGSDLAGLGLKKQFAGKDKDGDSIWYDKFYLSPDYPGELTQITPDSILYDRKGSDKQGKVIILAVATDGSLQSNLGKVCVTLQGSGSSLSSITAPTEIPGYDVPIAGSAPTQTLKAFELQGRNLLLLSSGHLEIYTLQGHRISLGGKNIGERVNLQNLPSGAYIAVLRNRSSVSTQRIYLK